MSKELTAKKRAALNRLKTVRGHLDGIVRMLEYLRRRDEHRARPLRAATDIRLLQPHRHRDDHL